MWRGPAPGRMTASPPSTWRKRFCRRCRGGRRTRGRRRGQRRARSGWKDPQRCSAHAAPPDAQHSVQCPCAAPLPSPSECSIRLDRQHREIAAAVVGDEYDFPAAIHAHVARQASFRRLLIESRQRAGITRDRKGAHARRSLCRCTSRLHSPRRERGRWDGARETMGSRRRSPSRLVAVSRSAGPCGRDRCPQTCRLRYTSRRREDHRPASTRLHPENFRGTYKPDKTGSRCSEEVSSR